MSSDGASHLKAEWHDGVARITLEAAETAERARLDSHSMLAMTHELESLRANAEHIPWPIWREDHAGVITWCNRAYLELADNVTGEDDLRPWPPHPVFDLTDEQTDRTFGEDEGVGLWSVRKLLGHLADAELVFTHRIRRIIAEDGPVLALWDHEAFLDSSIYGPELRSPAAGFVAAIHTMRRWTAELLMSLTPEQWERTAMHPEQGEVRVLKLVEYAAWHVENHAKFLKMKLDLMLGECEEVAAAGGCGSGCGCKSKAAE